MKSTLHVLHLEDNPDDALFADHRLKAGGIHCTIKRVDTREDFERELELGLMDLILCDFSMPQFNGLAALKIARQRRPDVPFIFLSGTIGEELAVEALREGATDYIIKDRLSRLPVSVKRAMREAREAAERRRMEQRLREQAELLDRARDAICLNDMQQNILYWNKSAERLYGWNSHEALGKNANDLLFQDDLTAPAEALRSLIRNGEWMGELHQVTKNGKQIIVESRWTLLRDSAGKPESILVINTDITERKQIEAQFLRTQRLEGIGALAGGIAHDLNNALAPVVMGVELIRRDVKTEEGQRHLDLMAAGTRRAVDMVRQILTFSRGVSGQHVSLRLRPLIDEMMQFATKTFPRSIRIQTSVADGLPSVIGNSTQLHQVLLNLCVNARDAMPDGGQLAIDAAMVELDAAALPRNGGFAPGSYVLLKVTDTGHGIPQEIQQKIFEPFFTTKELGKGSGLGLSTVMGIVKTHNGFLEVESESDKGTAFKIFLPSKSAKAVA
jgi:two-component system cell cycle sensor histidine kinase/response regulator CckA